VHNERALGLGMLAAGILLAVATWLYWTSVVDPVRPPYPGLVAPTPSVNASETASAAPAEPEEPPWTEEDDAMATTLAEQRKSMLRKMKLRLRLDDATIERVRQIVEAAPWLGQGNPAAVEHPMTRAQCREIREAAGLKPQWNQHCDAKNMVPLWNREAGETEADARVCIDQFEFPDIACEYPVTWVTARDAALLCQAIGKRLCDAHEWEGACAGSLRPVEQEYAFGKERVQMRYLHNLDRDEVWAYGPTKDHSRCATGSHKSRACTEIGWRQCGSNTYPAGAFPGCVSSFGVYDLHGNAAEHMNLPLKPEELASRGGMGQTEMKGSWFIFSTYEAHTDDCRWRAPDWHATRVMDVNSHHNYHLGFRCCKNLGEPMAPPSPTGEAGP